MGDISKACWAYLALVAFSLIGTAITAFAHVGAGPIPAVASTLTLLLGAYSALEPAVPAAGVRRVLLAAGALLALGAAVEICGLYTGFPFGRYEYTDRWAPTIALPHAHRFPLLLPVAWVMVVSASYLCGQRVRPVAKMIYCAAFLAAATDSSMESILSRLLRYWIWADPRDTLRWNLLGWVATAAVGGAILYRFRIRSESVVQPVVVLVGLQLLLLGFALIQGGLSWASYPLFGIFSIYVILRIAADCAGPRGQDTPEATRGR